jgi:hypothetical protein
MFDRSFPSVSDISASAVSDTPSLATSDTPFRIVSDPVFSVFSGTPFPSVSDAGDGLSDLHSSSFQGGGGQVLSTTLFVERSEPFSVSPSRFTTEMFEDSSGPQKLQFSLKFRPRISKIFHETLSVFSTTLFFSKLPSHSISVVISKVRTLFSDDFDISTISQNDLNTISVTVSSEDFWILSASLPWMSESRREGESGKSPGSSIAIFATVGAVGFLILLAVVVIFFVRRAAKSLPDEVGDYPIETELPEESCGDDYGDDIAVANSFLSLNGEPDLGQDWDEAEGEGEWPGFD